MKNRKQFAVSNIANLILAITPNGKVRKHTRCKIVGIDTKPYKDDKRFTYFVQYFKMCKLDDGKIVPIENRTWHYASQLRHCQ